MIVEHLVEEEIADIFTDDHDFICCAYKIGEYWIITPESVSDWYFVTNGSLSAKGLDALTKAVEQMYRKVDA